MANLQQLEGLVLSAFGGFYEVWVGGAAHQCRLRGKLKRKRFSEDGETGVFVGDRVRISLQQAGPGETACMVEEVLPRQNLLPRPRVANVGQAVAVLAARDPAYDLLLLDQILLVAAFYGSAPALCVNKADLAGPELDAVLAVYRRAGFVVVRASARAQEGLAELSRLLANKVSVFAGPSGVGKSSLLNALLPELDLAVGEISERLQRGKHTTRHVSLLPLAAGGYVADAPGFSLLDLPRELAPEALEGLYPEFRAPRERCRFLSCQHKDEPDCGVKAALAAGQIDAQRYERYLRLHGELTEREVIYPREKDQD